MGSSLIRRSAAAAVLLLCGVSVVACDDEPDPAPDTESSSTPSSPSTSPVTTSSPTAPVEPTLPAEAEKATKAGAEAFVEYYVDLINYAQKTGDIAALEAAALPSCATCRGGAASIREIYARGGRISGGEYSLAEIKTVRSPSRARTWFIEADVHVGKQRVTGAGDLNAHYDASAFGVLFSVRHEAGVWGITSWDRE